LVPKAFSVNPALATGTDVVERDVSVNPPAPATENGTEFEICDVGVTTDRKPVPAVARAEEGRVAVSRVASMKLVLSVNGAADPKIQRTVEPLTNPEPVTVTSVVGLPAEAELGAIEEIAGAATGWIVNVSGFEISPPGFDTRIVAEPAEAIRAEGTVADKPVLEKNAVVREVVAEGVTHCTVEPFTKFVPVTLILNVGEPTIALGGETPPGAMVGTAPMAKGKSRARPPVALVTLKMAMPVEAMSDAGTTATNCDEFT